MVFAGDLWVTIHNGSGADFLGTQGVILFGHFYPLPPTVQRASGFPTSSVFGSLSGYLYIC